VYSKNHWDNYFKEKVQKILLLSNTIQSGLMLLFKTWNYSSLFKNDQRISGNLTTKYGYWLLLPVDELRTLWIWWYIVLSWKLNINMHLWD